MAKKRRSQRHARGQPYRDGRARRPYIAVAPNPIVIAPHVMPRQAKADVLETLAPVIQLTRGTLILVANPMLGVKDARELTALAHKRPGLTYGTAGVGTPMHIAGELYNRSARVGIVHVSYKGTGPALVDLLGGHVSMAFSSLASVSPYLQSGQLVPIGVIQKERSPLLPNVPTLTEQGVPGVELTTWFGVFAPSKTPPAVLEKLNREINTALAAPEMRKRFETEGEADRRIGGRVRRCRAERLSPIRPDHSAIWRSTGTD